MQFIKTEGIIEQINCLDRQTADMLSPLSSYPDCLNPLLLNMITDSVRMKVRDFLSEDRKLNIAVIGQVKAGKSTFLNELLFHGEALLPFDCLPKTSVLTKTEYSQSNRLIVEYINQDDLSSMKALAKLNETIPNILACRDAVKRIEQLDYPIEEYLCLGTQEIPINEIENLFGTINDYVGEDGIYTPLVKTVTIALNLPILHNVVIVDTPGLNDYVASRTAKTIEFIESSDAVFFLSRSGSFLDVTDRSLLSDLIAKKSIKNLTVIGSQLDSALIDISCDYPTLEEACRQARLLLEQHASSVLYDIQSRLQINGSSREIMPAILLISAMAERISGKARAALTDDEELILKQLSFCNDISDDMLINIGGFPAMRGLFLEILEKKDDILSSKAIEFVAMVKSDIKQRLSELRKMTAQKRDKALQSEAVLRRDETVSVIQAYQSKLESAFFDYTSPLKNRLAAASIELSSLTQIYTVTPQNEDVDIHTAAQTVSDAKLFLPWTWGKKHIEYSVEAKPIAFIDTEDCTQSLRYLAEHTKTLHIQVFQPFSDLSGLKSRLNRISSNMSFERGELPDTELISAIAEKSLRGLTVPGPGYDSAPYERRISERFYGRISESSSMEELSLLYSNTAQFMLLSFFKQLTKAGEDFMGSADYAKARFASLLFEGAYNSLKEARAKLEEQTDYVNRCNELIERIDITLY